MHYKMIQTLKTNLIINCEECVNYQKQIAKSFENFISDHSKAIKEINALENRQEISTQLKYIVRALLPEAIVEEIVDAWILQFSNGPYTEYVSTQSKKWNFDIGKGNAIVYHPLYSSHLNDFLGTKEKKE